MKRQLALPLAIIFTLLTFTACGQTAAETTEAPTRTPTPESELDGLTPEEILEKVASDEMYFEPTTPEPTEEPDYSDRIVLTIGRYGDSYPMIASEFNSTQDEYVLEVVDYSQGGTISENNAIIKLNADLATGNGPDIIDFSSFSTEANTYGSRGYLEDLYPYLDSDPELGREDLLEPALKAFEYDGALYQTVSGFSLVTILSSQSVADSLSSWTFADLMEIANQNPDAPSFYANDFQRLCMFMTNVFVDYDNLTAYFDTDGFKDFLRFTGSLPEYDFGSAGESSTKVPPLNLAAFTYGCFTEMQYYNWLFDNEVAVLGFPSVNGEGATYLCDNFAPFGMNAASERKDAVWQCLRYVFTEDYRDMIYIPINRNKLQERIDDEQKTHYKLDKDGNETDEIDPPTGNVQGFPYHPAADEEVGQVLDIIGCATDYFRRDSTITSIILEESEAFLAGDKTVDEVANLIQSRVSLYLGEQK